MCPFSLVLSGNEPGVHQQFYWLVLLIRLVSCPFCLFCARGVLLRLVLLIVLCQRILQRFVVYPKKNCWDVLVLDFHCVDFSAYAGLLTLTIHFNYLLGFIQRLAPQRSSICEARAFIFISLVVMPANTLLV
jgi:hypothetical protein